MPVFCRECRTANAENAKFCVRCGTNLRAVDATGPRSVPDTDSWRGYYARGCLGIGSMLIAIGLTVMALMTFANYPVADLLWLGVAVIFFVLGRKYWPKR